MSTEPREPAQLRELRTQLITDPELVEAIAGRLEMFPPAPLDPDRVVRCSPVNVDRAIARMLAAAEWGELWRVEVVQ
jgi:hypothetical protein